MLLTCPECETQYRLNQALLGDAGRRVRCTTCLNVWMQYADGRQGPAPVGSHAHEEDHHELVDHAPAPPLPVEADLMEQLTGKSFAETLAAEEGAAHKIPDVVKPKGTGFDIAVTEYRPMGMGPAMFGIFTFLMFTFITLSLLFVFKKQVVSAMPSTALLYETIGMHVKAPGEGLRLSEVAAEHVIERGEKKLSISAKLANITDADITHPVLKATLKGPYGAVLEEWDLRDEAGKKISSGASVPVKAEFDGVPDGGTTIELKVIK